MGDDLDLAARLGRDGDHVGEVAGVAVDLDALMEVLLEVGDVDDLLLDRLGSVENELYYNKGIKKGSSCGADGASLDPCPDIQGMGGVSWCRVLSHPAC